MFLTTPIRCTGWSRTELMRMMGGECDYVIGSWEDFPRDAWQTAVIANYLRQRQPLQQQQQQQQCRMMASLLPASYTNCARRNRTCSLICSCHLCSSSLHWIIPRHNTRSWAFFSIPLQVIFNFPISFSMFFFISKQWCSGKFGNGGTLGTRKSSSPPSLPFIDSLHRPSLPLSSFSYHSPPLPFLNLPSRPSSPPFP